jgi:hypothetical protein
MNLSRNLALPTVTTRVVGTLQMVFTNSIINHVNTTTNQPLMNSKATRGYKSVNAVNLRGGCLEFKFN